MKLTVSVKNFKCFDDATFAFSDKTSTLITGRSGVGKSSIFAAIAFALTGEGKKICKFGKSSCAVKLVIDDSLKIERKKGPCRLLVTVIDGERETVYEDSVAEKIIATKFPDWEIGYMKQRQNDCFLTMTPNEKIAFLERVIFGGDNLFNVVNKRLKDETARRKTYVRETSLQKASEEAILEKTVGPYSIAYSDYDDDENNFKSPTKINDDIKETERRIVNSRLIDSIRESIETIRRPTDYTDIDEIDRELTAWKKLTDEREKAKRMAELRINLNSLNREMAELSSNVPSLDEYRSLVVATKSIDEKRSALKEIDDIKSTSYYNLSCPSCGTNIKCTVDGEFVNDNNLSINKSAGSRVDLKAARLKLDQLVGRVAKCDADCNLVPSGLRYLLDERRDKESIRDELLSLKRRVDRRDKIESDIKRVRWSLNDDDSGVDELTARVIEPALSVDQLEEMKRRLVRYAVQRVNLQQLTSSTSYDGRTTEAYETELRSLQSSLLASRSRKAAVEWNKVKRRDELIATGEKSIASILKLKELVDSTKTIAFNESIVEINERCQFYVAKFFQHDDVVVKILVEENNKPVIYVSVDGKETDVNCLSGGEFARVSLAFTLAFVEFCDSDAIFVDEILAPLDESCADRVMKVVDKYFAGTFLCISHQAVKGTFDHVVNVE